MDATPPQLQAVIVLPEQAPMIRAFGLNIKVLLTTEASGGAIAVLMVWHKPGEGPPDHVHFSQDEIFFIVEGTYELTVGDQTSVAGPSARRARASAERSVSTRSSFSHKNPPLASGSRPKWP